MIHGWNQALLLCVKIREAQSKATGRSPSYHFYVRNVKFWVDEGGTGVGETNVLILHGMQKQDNLLIVLQLDNSTTTNPLTFLSGSYTFPRAAACSCTTPLDQANQIGDPQRFTMCYAHNS
jgi:hypothetical protein